MIPRHIALGITCLATLLLAAPAGAQMLTPDEPVCVSIDQAHDTLSPEDRAAALLVLGREFQLAGHRVVDEGCRASFALSHIRLGADLDVSLEGLARRVEGDARGLEDLRPLYNQMVRSFVTGKPIAGFNVIDRTNVTAAQETEAHRIPGDSFGYARVGYSGMFGDRVYGGGGFGFGHRTELDSLGIDVSFLNTIVPGSGGYYDTSAQAGSFELLRLEALHFLRPRANATAYVGGGVGYGWSSFDGGTSPFDNRTYYRTPFEGKGILGTVTVGYEAPRASVMRVFVQADVTLPFYLLESTRATYGYGGAGASIERRYAPSVAVSLGVGWGRHRK